jgi:long-subunit fatty acid transport protein
MRFPTQGWTGPAVALAALALAVPLAVPIDAQTNDEIQTGTQFNFSTPGARSLGMGAAFVAVADDATAAYSNPAGLALLGAPEVSLEVRHFSFQSRFTARGHLPETGLTGIGIDTVDGLEEGSARRADWAPSFLSAVYVGGRWSAAVFRHQLADFRGALDSQGPFVGFRERTSRVAPARSRIDLEIANVGVAGGVRLSPTLSLGAALSRFDFSLDSRTERYARRPATGDALTDSRTGGPFGPADFTPENVFNTQTQTGDDGALSGNAGILWRPSSRWTAGLVYRRGPRFDFDAAFIYGPAGDRPGESERALGGRGVFRLPDLWGLGVAFRPADAWVVALDLDRVEYSSLSRDLVNLLEAARGELASFSIDDVVEPHLGVEYQALWSRLPFSVRLGTWLDPAHRLRYTGRDNALRARFRPGRDELHVSGGVGLVWRRLQVDLAADVADSSSTLSLSAVKRF